MDGTNRSDVAFKVKDDCDVEETNVNKVDRKFSITDLDLNILPLLSETKRVLVVGDIVLDRYIHGYCPRVAADAPIPSFVETSIEHCLGGTANVARNLRALELDVDFVSVLGTDSGLVLEMLSDIGISTAGVVVVPCFQTKTITKYVSGNVTMFRTDKVSDVDIEKGTAERVLSNVRDLMNKNKYEITVLCDYRSGNASNKFAQGVVSEAKSHGVPVLVDPKRGGYSNYKGAFIIKPNENDADILCGNNIVLPRDAEMVCKEFTEGLNIDNCILTMSGHGMAIYKSKVENGESKLHIRSVNKNITVVDTNGAGDSVTAAIAFGVAHGLGLDMCCRLATSCAEYVIQRHGTVIISLIDVMPDKVIRTEQELVNLKRIIPSSLAVVLTTACSDVPLSSNVSALQQAKQLGNILVVAFNTCTSLHEHHNKEIVISLENQVNLLKNLAFVDYVVLCDSKMPKWIVDNLNPDIVVADDDSTSNMKDVSPY